MQVNVLGTERRRRWSYDEKVRLVEETCRLERRSAASHAGTGLPIACCLPGVDKRARVGSAEIVPALVPVEITPVAPISSDAPQPASSPPAQRGRAVIIEIELGGGCRVRVDRDVDLDLFASARG